MTGGAPGRERAFIRDNLPLVEVPGTGGIRLHLARPDSGLVRLVPAGGTPFWAHAWPGGLALAAHLAADPEAVRGRSVVDLGAGSGLAGIAAWRAGAGEVLALDADRLACVATTMNAAANAASVQALVRDVLDEPPAAATVILVGDLFYDAGLAVRVAAFLDRAEGASILVGDIGRDHLPRTRLEPLASYLVRDVGDPPQAPLRQGWVYRWRAP